MKPRKIKISQKVKDKRAGYDPESRSENFHLGRVNNGDLARLTDANGRAALAVRMHSMSQTGLTGEGVHEARNNLKNTKRTIYPTDPKKVDGSLKSLGPS